KPLGCFGSSLTDLAAHGTPVLGVLHCQIMQNKSRPWLDTMSKVHSSTGLRVLIITTLLLGGMLSWRQDRALAVMGLASAAAISVFTRPAILAYNRGRERWLKGDLSGAVEQLSLALQQDPNLTNAYLLRGKAYFALNQVPLALADFDRAIQLAPRRPESYSCRALIRVGQADTEGAIADLTQLVALRPSATYHIHLANLLAQQGSLPIALTHLNEAIQLDPTSTPAFAARASLHSYLGEWEAALADWSKAIELQPDPALYYNRGVTYSCADRYDEAIADLDRSLEADPQQPNTLYNRGNALYELGEMKAALDDYDRAFRLEANRNQVDVSDEYGLYGRGLAHCHMGDKVTALSDWQAALAVCRKHHNLALAKQVQRSWLRLNSGDPNSDPADPDTEQSA
ncbi:MAG: tetratricopeptide repeat protein, partial [Cyanobacteriota bacterium]